MFRYHTGLSLGKEQAISQKVVASCICDYTENVKKKKKKISNLRDRQDFMTYPNFIRKYHCHKRLNHLTNILIPDLILHLILSPFTFCLSLTFYVIRKDRPDFPLISVTQHSSKYQSSPYYSPGKYEENTLQGFKIKFLGRIQY